MCTANASQGPVGQNLPIAEALLTFFGLAFNRKFLLAVVTLLAPEVINVTVFGQYLSAWESVESFAAAGHTGWTMRHAFLADMGGFILQPRDWKQFPINAKQLLWLIENGYVAMPQVDTAVIRDKNKTDGFMRLITAFQITWFCVNFFGRLAQGLAITAIELTTVAFIYCALGSMFFWRHKPADVETAEILYTNATMKEILVAGGEAAREPYRQTPLDFVSRQEWSWSKYLAHFQNATVARFRSRSVPIDHISSATKQILWRVATIGNLVSLAGGELLTDWVFYILPFIKAKWNTKVKGVRIGNQKTRNDSEPQETGPNFNDSRKDQKIQARPRSKRSIWDTIRNNSPSNDPHLTVPLKAILPLWGFVVVYSVCRIYIVVADFIELRSLPLSAFETVEWSGLFPHI
ncbi:uncharacterized protein J7T55_005973 [Diaporthe amygdali]|uniref:uncharacterized protein n=1 Tax=Phomopsis amygdali TaxID=1214568 RepID=UPI0022FF11CC|nr:uncharacterized protein J7T55_005973 [Diaporthe amygdali]KAJ0124633.1 uncharacterized protein J7T55_005973 [Diaporthe amygdali]